MAIKPEDVLPDDINSTVLSGRQVRKGTIAAVLANTKIIESDSTTASEKQEALAMIKQLAPAVVAIGLTDHVTWKNTLVQQIFDEITC